MARSIWKWSHLILALVASVFLILSSISGFFLAFEPISKELNGQSSRDWKTISLEECIKTLNSKYLETTTLEKNESDQFIASVLTEDGEFLTIPINPETGEKVGKSPEQSTFFKWMTTFHRSLFLDTTGRFLVGFMSVLLVFIALSGIILVFQRSKSFKSFFDKVEKTSKPNYYHIVFGRYFFIPILIIALTGGYLFLQRFKVIEEQEKEALNVNWNKPISTTKKVDFAQIQLGDIEKVEFPFSPDEEDYFIIQTNTNERAVDQYTFNVLAETSYPNSHKLKQLSLDLHTGSIHFIWAIVLSISCLSMLYFIYSGLKMFYLKSKSKVRNDISYGEAECLLLVGSEGGKTMRYAQLLQEQLQLAGVKVFTAEMNKYKPSTKLKEVIVLTSTYGLGEAPSNANRFIAKWKQQPLNQEFNYTIVGFGSLAYPEFCQFALDVEKTLKAHPSSHERLPIAKIHNQSYHSFKTWANSYSKSIQLNLHLPAQFDSVQLKLHPFTLIHKASIFNDSEETFTLTFQSSGKVHFSSGDLLTVYPAADPVERFYSIGKLNHNTFVISVKRHDLGVCSSMLSQLILGETLQAGIKSNNAFHFEAKKAAIFISNGTGIGPFLGMITEENQIKKPTYLYWGGRNQNSYELYQSFVDRSVDNQQLTAHKIAFSREGNKMYVSDLIRIEGEHIATQLREGAVIYICGSLQMQQDVISELTEICRRTGKKPFQYYQQKGQVKMDCY